jgi:hypothetical protein
MQWAVDMSGVSPLAAQLLANYTLRNLGEGFDGAWYDNFGPALFNGKTTTGSGLRMREMWDPNHNRNWTHTLFMDAQKSRFAEAMREVQTRTGLSHRPPIVANGFSGVKYPDGACDVTHER